MKKMGRPKSDNRLDMRVTVRFNEVEYTALMEYAETHNVPVTQVVRESVRRLMLESKK